MVSNRSLKCNDKTMTIPINEQLSLSPQREGDEDALVRWLNDPVLQRNTLRIPFPYRTEHAREFIDYVGAMRAEHGRPTEWAIRDGGGAVIGGIGFSRVYGKYSHKDELGYWLAQPYRGQGIMTEVVGKVCEVGFGPYKLLRIEAPNLRIQRGLGPGAGEERLRGGRDFAQLFPQERQARGREDVREDQTEPVALAATVHPIQAR
jgi:RimJ/RimL family protein N-acetyltransferase